MNIEKTKISAFTDLKVWKSSHIFVLEVYKLTRKFPKDEKFALANQLRRAAVSITSNIAEGFGRKTAKDKSQFYSISKGSLLECQSQLYVARDLGYITESTFTSLNSSALEIVRMISGLVNSAMTKSEIGRPNTNTPS